jgi:hypothetical protein
MSQRKFSKRHNSYEILNESLLWVLSENELKIDENLSKILESENKDFSVEYIFESRFRNNEIKILFETDWVITKPYLETKLNSIKS